jgi:hypothetical protein
MNLTYNSKLGAIIVSLVVIINAAMLSVASNDELIHGIWVTNVQLIATALATYCFLQR